MLISHFLLISGCGGGGGGDEANPFPESEFTKSITLAWRPPSTNEDGTRLRDLMGYKVYYGTSSRYYQYSVTVGNVTSAFINVYPGFWCFAISAYDTSGNESDHSGEICADIQPDIE
jgi:hypothetical protein